MNCKQVSNLSFAYCDHEVHNHTRAELERHLQECPECQKMMDFTLRETEALRYEGDIPDLRPNFSQDIILGITKKYSAKKSLRSGWLTRKRLRNIMTGNIVAGSLAAVLLLSWFLVPGARENLMSAFDTSADKAGQTRVAKSEPAAQKTENFNTLGNAQLGAPLTLTLPTSAKWAPDYNTSAPRMLAGRSAGSLKTAAPADQSYGDVKVSVPMFQPLYLPEGYHFTSAVPDTDGNCTLAYENNQGSRISLKIVQIGNEIVEQLDASGSPKSAESGSSSKDSTILPETAPKMAPAAVNSVEEAQIGSIPAADGGQAKATAAANEASNSSNQATMIWTMSYMEKFYCLELAGALSPEELGKIAASIKPVE